MHAPARADFSIAAGIRRASVLIAWSALLVIEAHAASSLPSSLPIDASADFGTLDLRKDVYVMRGNVRVSQGEMLMEAQEATVDSLRSKWTLETGVHIKTAEADLRSDSATASVQNEQIHSAVVQGTPAAFEQRKTTGNKTVRGRANLIEYDFASGIVKLSDNVWFSYGGNEFRGSTVVYNVREERVVVNPGGQQSGRVNITIRPRSQTQKPPAENPAPGRDEGGS